MKTPGSAELFRKASSVTPGGVMAGIKFFEPYPVFMKDAGGSLVTDVDGNQYIDYLMSYGALILGHGVPRISEAIHSVLLTTGTTVTGTPTQLELEFGATLRDAYLPGGLMRFTNSGMEATLLAVRLARAYTGRRKIAKFEGHYHGSVDSLLFSYSPSLERAGSDESPVPIGDSADVSEEMLSNSMTMPFNDWESTESLLLSNGAKLACVIMEPFQEGVIPADPKFLENVRKVTSDLGIPLIFDEVKTGFRVGLKGATGHYGIVPDITCLGKIIGGGLPIGAVIGSEEIMSLLNPSGQRKKVFHSGTFNGNPLSVGVGMATVEELRAPGRFEELRSRTNSLKESLSVVLSENGIEHRVLGEGGMFNFYLTDRPVRNYRDAKKSDLRTRRFLDIELINRGVYLKPENRFCLSLAHSQDDISRTKEIFNGAVAAIVKTGS